MTDVERAEEFVMSHAKEAIQEQTPYFKFAEQMFLAGLKAGRPVWHKVSAKLPEMDVYVYLWFNHDDFPVVARRQIPYGREEKDWVWACKWGSGFSLTPTQAKDGQWQELVLPKE